MAARSEIAATSSRRTRWRKCGGYRDGGARGPQRGSRGRESLRVIVDRSSVPNVIDSVHAVSKERELEVKDVATVIPSMIVLELSIGVGKVEATTVQRRHVESVRDPSPIVDMTPSVSLGGPDGRSGNG